MILDRVEYLGRIDVKHAESQKILREHELILGGDYKQYDYKVTWRYDSMIQNKKGKGFWKKLYDRPEICPYCGKSACNIMQRIFSTPKTNIVCPYCGKVSYTPFYVYLIPVACTIIAAIVAFGPPDKYVSQRYKRVLYVAVVSYFLSGFILMFLFPLKKRRG